MPELLGPEHFQHLFSRPPGALERLMPLLGEGFEGRWRIRIAIEDSGVELGSINLGQVHGAQPVGSIMPQASQGSA